MNQPILCCLKIKPATLFIGVTDLMMHMMVLATLFAAYSHPALFDHYYSNSISLVVSPTSSLYSIPMSANKNGDLKQSTLFSGATAHSSGTSSVLNQADFIKFSEQGNNNHASSVQNPNAINGPFLWQLQQAKPRPFVESFQDKTTSIEIQSNRLGVPKEKSLAFLITIFSSFLTIMLIYGILKNKGNLLMPYFSIKVFQVVMACLTTLGFYNCLPNVRWWIETHRYFPLKRELLLLENQTLELFVFSILISSVLIKLYIVIIVWYCYRYMITLESFRNMHSTSIGYALGSLSTEDLNNNGFKTDEENHMSTQPPPPKYDDIMKQAQANTSRSENEDLPTSSSAASSVIVPLFNNASQQPPSYTSAITKMI